MLYILHPASAVLSSPLSEPLFALLTFTGFYLAVERHFLMSSLFLAGATAVRATGILAVGPIAWMIIIGDGPLVEVLLNPRVCLR
jgi:Gpi18-like mannosyltransferase